MDTEVIRCGHPGSLSQQQAMAHLFDLIWSSWHCVSKLLDSDTGNQVVLPFAPILPGEIWLFLGDRCVLCHAQPYMLLVTCKMHAPPIPHCKLTAPASDSLLSDRHDNLGVILQGKNVDSSHCERSKPQYSPYRAIIRGVRALCMSLYLTINFQSRLSHVDSWRRGMPAYPPQSHQNADYQEDYPCHLLVHAAM